MIYIECAGVRIPIDWTVDKLKVALAKRKIRFPNEADIITAFGTYVDMLRDLQKSIEFKRRELAGLDSAIAAKKYGPVGGKIEKTPAPIGGKKK